MSDDPEASVPGWKADPTGHHVERFWDGGRWTEHIRDGDVPGTDSLGAPPPAQRQAPDEAAPSRRGLSMAEQLEAAARTAAKAMVVAEQAATDAGLLKKGKVSKFGLVKGGVRPLSTTKKVADSLTSSLVSSDAEAPGSSSGQGATPKPSVASFGFGSPRNGDKMIVHEVVTSLSVQDIALLFRSGVESPRGFQTKDLTWEFFEPRSPTTCSPPSMARQRRRRSPSGRPTGCETLDWAISRAFEAPFRRCRTDH